MTKPIKKMNSGQRIAGYDLARALAIFGMIVVNFNIALTDHNRQSAAWAEAIPQAFSGRAAALFVVLAGVGVSLMTHKAVKNADSQALAAKRKMLFKRALILFVVGVAWLPIWAADILHFYALYFLLSLVFLKVSGKQLWFWILIFLSLFVVLFLTFDYQAGWDWEALSNLSIVTPIGFFRNLFFNGFHPVIPWAAFLLVGMWLGRQNVSDPLFRRRLFWIALITALSIEALSAGLVRTATSIMAQETADFLLGTGPLPPLPFYMIAATSTALVLIMSCIALAERFAKSTWLNPLLATGQLALSLYMAHVLLGMGLMQALNLFEGQTAEFALFYAIAFFILSVVFAHLWRARFPRGPLEALLRRLSA